MTTTADPIGVVKELVARYARQDPSVLQLIHDDAVLEFPGDPAVLPWAGRFSARELQRFLLAVGTSIEILVFELRDAETEGDWVICRTHEVFRVRATGRICNSELVQMIRVKDGKIIALHEHSDTAAMQDAFLGAAEAPLSVAKAVMACRMAGDPPAMLAHAAPDCSWILPGDPAVLPWAGRWRGADVARALAALRDSVEQEAFDPHTFRVTGDVVVAVARERFVARATRRVCDAALAVHMTVRGGRLVSLQEYADTAARHAAFR
jgi:ketosteroid isomerase-like protein